MERRPGVIPRAGGRAGTVGLFAGGLLRFGLGCGRGRCGGRDEGSLGGLIEPGCFTGQAAEIIDL